MRTSRTNPIFRALFAGATAAALIAAPAAADHVPGWPGGLWPAVSPGAGRELPAGPAPARRMPVPAGPAAPDDGASPGPAPVYGPLGLPCFARLGARPGPGGTALLRIEAPCDGGARVGLAHGPLSATYELSPSGELEAVFPAFETPARYTARLAGTTLSASVAVPGAAGYERVATMWVGPAALSVHAFEYGAGPGDAGHVWRGAPRAATVAESGRGGFLLSLGASSLPDARRAEVYSFPAAGAARAGSVRLALGAAVNAETCGREIAATLLQIGQDLPGAPVGISLRLPDCGSGTGDLMLKNLARDLKIAAQ